MQLYIVQFKQYQGIILILLKHVDNRKLQGHNCNAALGFLLPQRQTKLLLFQKTLAHKKFSHDNCTVKNF